MSNATETRELQISTKCAPLIKLLAGCWCSVVTAEGRVKKFNGIARAERWLVENGYIELDA